MQSEPPSNPLGVASEKGCYRWKSESSVPEELFRMLFGDSRAGHRCKMFFGDDLTNPSRLIFAIHPNGYNGQSRIDVTSTVADWGGAATGGFA